MHVGDSGIFIAQSSLLYNKKISTDYKTLACYKSGKFGEVVSKAMALEMDNWIINYRVFIEELNRILGLHFKLPY